jgi:drug/metabolite transporter (DMT)-like permease
MKLIAGCAFLLNTVFFATYYSVTKEALSRIDPIVFTFFEMVSLAPAGLLIILFSWKSINRGVVRRGILLGSMLCLALFTIAIALKYATATSTAFFPALNGLVAAIIAWALFREPLKGSTWLAGLLSVGGAALLIFTSSAGNFRGTMIAFLGGLFYTVYIFLCDHEQKDEKAQWALFGVELLTTAVWANLVALLFGDWQAVHPVLPKDIEVVLFVAVACTFVPTLITVLLQKYISPVTVSFIYILEPILGALIANLYLGEVLPISGYIGGGLVVLGALINTWGTFGQDARQRRQKQRVAAREVRGSWVSMLLYPALGCVLGSFLLYHLGGVPPASWNEVYQAWPRLSQDLHQGQGAYVALLLVQAGGWLVAWSSVLLMGYLALANMLRLLFQPIRPAQARSAPRGAVEQPASPMNARPVISPTRRVRTTALSPEQQPLPARTYDRQPQQRARVTRRLPEQGAPRIRTTERLPEQSVPRAHTSGRLPEQPTWYGEAIWHTSPLAGSGPETPVPSTEPLLYRTDVRSPRLARRSMEQFDEEKTRSL